MNTSEIHLYAEKLSSKMNWNLVERLFHSQSHKKIHIELGRKGEDVIKLEPVPQEETQKKNGISQAKRTSLGSKRFKPYVGYPSLGI